MSLKSISRRLPVFASNMVTRLSHTSDSNQLVETENLGKVFLIGINRPEKRNCANTATGGQLIDAIKHFENDDSLSVAVLHGKGGTFCAGYDLSELSSKDASNLPDFNRMMGRGEGPMGPSRAIFSKPVIAAVSGYAVAGGLELSLMCDMRVAEESAVFGVFCRRFGVPLIDGGTVRLPHLIGLSRAMDMILTGRPVPAQEALQMGLANRVVPDGQALEESIKLANQIAAFPQKCMRRDRLSAYNAMYNAKSFQDAIDYELGKGIDVLQEESVKGAKSFVSGLGRGGNFDAFTGKSKL